MEYSEFKERFGGIIVPLITPLDMHGEVHAPSLERLVNYVITGSPETSPEKDLFFSLVNGFLVNGTTGEFMHMDYGQRMRNLRLTTKFANGAVLIIANITANDPCKNFSAVIHDAKEAMRDANDIGADAFLFCPLFYQDVGRSRISNRSNLIAVVENLADCAGKLNKPLVLYDNKAIHHSPKDTTLDDRDVGLLSHHGFIAGLKYSSGDIRYFAALASLQSESFGVFQGSESMIYHSRENLHVAGIVPSFACISPKLVKEMYENPTKERQEKFDKLREPIYGYQNEHIIAGIKSFLHHNDIISHSKMAAGSEIDLGSKNVMSFVRENLKYF